MFRDEGFPRHVAHGGKERRVIDATRAEVAGDHHRPVAGVGVVQKFRTLHCYNR